MLVLLRVDWCRWVILLCLFLEADESAFQTKPQKDDRPMTYTPHPGIEKRPPRPPNLVLHPRLHDHRRLLDNPILLPHARPRARLQRPQSSIHDRTNLRRRLHLQRLHRLSKRQNPSAARPRHRKLADIINGMLHRRLCRLQFHSEIRAARADGGGPVVGECAELVVCFVGVG